MKFFQLLLLFLLSISANCQNLLNGDFSSGNTNWGSPVETNVEATYGGSGANRVAEVDYAAKLSQTISGFQIGTQYSLLFKSSRRTKVNQEAPNPSTINVKILNGSTVVMSKSLTKTNTTFRLDYQEYTFTATATSLTLTITAGADIGTVTRGVIIDNISITPIVALPVELINFYSLNKDGIVELNWETATENNNDYYEVEKSIDVYNWDKVGKVDGKGDTKSHSYYSISDNTPSQGITYYRLIQVDRNGNKNLSKIITNKVYRELSVFPNPTINKTLYIDFDQNESLLSLTITDLSGKNVISKTVTENQIDLFDLKTGNYILLLQNQKEEIKKMNIFVD